MDFHPRKIPFKCVVCSGFGTLKNGTLRCHGCDGKGWVVVDQDSREKIEGDIQNIDIKDINDGKSGLD